MAYNPSIPFNDLPALPPKADLETIAILKKTILASRALSELKGAVTNLPNPALFIDTINLQEAQASSAIENIITTQDELFKASVADKLIDEHSRFIEDCDLKTENLPRTITEWVRLDPERFPHKIKPKI